MADLKRSTNFSTKEIEYLIHLVDKKKDVIECKKTDRTSSEEKLKCWMEIEAEFNCFFDSFRSSKNLKTKYENLKKTAKQNYAKEKQEMYQTGGGPKPVTNVTSIDENILKLVPEQQIAGQNSIYDDDFLVTHELQDSQTNEEFFMDESFQKESEENTPQCMKWNKYSPKMLKTQKHEALKAGEKKNTKDVWAEVAEMKKQKIQLEMRVIKEEWELRKIKLGNKKPKTKK